MILVSGAIDVHVELEDWKNGWYGIDLALTTTEIDVLIDRLTMLKEEPDQHFHIYSLFQEVGGVGGITVSVQRPSEPSNMEAIGGRALAPGQTIPLEDVATEPPPD